MESHSSRVRGLKCFFRFVGVQKIQVALFTGAWIEMQIEENDIALMEVALFTGAWIEITMLNNSLAI